MTSAWSGVAGALRRAPMFQDRANTIVTLVLGTGIAWVAVRFGQWAVARAIWSLPATGSAACRALRSSPGGGACWAVIVERSRFILLGAYPADQAWRPVLACLLFGGLYGVSARRAWWRPWLAALWIAVPAAAIALLAAVPSDSWGGLPLTLLLATAAFAAATPLGVALALGRRSPLPAIRGLCLAFIELARGVPLVTFLFMAAVMFPLFMPQTLVLTKLLRAGIAFTLVIAAYLAEVLRGGLAAVPPGQVEAASSLGMSYWATTFRVVLPQAVRVSIPALVNIFLAFFKDTSLVGAIGLFDLLGTAKAVVVDPQWVGFGVEVYLFVAALYFVFCSALSRYSLRLERQLPGPGGIAP